MNLQPKSEKLREICQANEIEMLGVFGSVARGEDTEESDVDLLVKFRKTPDLIEFIQLEDKFSEVLEREIDLVTEGFLHPKIKESAMKDLRILYETT